MSSVTPLAQSPRALCLNAAKLGTRSLVHAFQAMGIQVIEAGFEHASGAIDPSVAYVCSVVDSLADVNHLSQLLRQHASTQAKWLVLMVGDVAFESHAASQEHAAAVSQWAGSLLDATRQWDTDLRIASVYGAGGEGTGKSALDQLIQLLGQRSMFSSTSSVFYPMSLPDFSQAIMRVLFDRGHKRSLITVRGDIACPAARILEQLGKQAPHLTAAAPAYWDDGAAAGDREVVAVPGVSEASFMADLKSRVAPDVPKKPELKPREPSLFQAVVVADPLEEMEPIAPPKAQEQPLPATAASSPVVLPSVPAKKEVVQPVRKPLEPPRPSLRLPKLPTLSIRIGRPLAAGSLLAVAVMALAVGLFSLPLIQNPDPSDADQLNRARLQIVDRQAALSVLPDLPLLVSVKQGMRQLIAEKEVQLIKFQADQLYAAAVKTMLTAGQDDPYRLLQQAKLFYEDLYVRQAVNQVDRVDADQIAKRRRFIEAVPYLIPSDKQTNVLVLLQNNLELRPSGGFLGAVVILSFDHGKLINTEIRDIYDLDSNLKGTVTPPADIVTHLGESNWFFRDANWFPHFKDTASNARWFLDKERGITADVVIGVNLYTFQNILAATGPVTLPNGEIISADNILVTAFNHQDAPVVKPDAQKQEFLSLLVKPVLDRLSQGSVAAVDQLFGALEAAADHGDLTFSASSGVAASLLNDLEWSGDLTPVTCPPTLAPPCVSDELYLNEANVGINKANYYVTRQRQHQLSLAPGQAAHTETITYTNASPSDQWPGGSYKSFIRMYLPAAAKVEAIQVDAQPVTPDAVTQAIVGPYTQLTLYLEVKPQANRSLEVRYVTPLNGASSYQWTLRRQPGQSPDNVSLSLNAGAVAIRNLTTSAAAVNNAASYTAKLDQNLRLQFELSP